MEQQNIWLVVVPNEKKKAIHSFGANSRLPLQKSLQAIADRISGLRGTKLKKTGQQQYINRLSQTR